MKPQKLFYFLVLFLAVLLSCNQSKIKAGTSTDIPNSSVQKVGLHKLAKNVQAFEGKLVEVQGEFSFNFEDVSLYDGSLFPDGHIRFWLNFKDDMGKDENLLKQLSGKDVVIRGKVNSNKKGHLGWYLAQLDSVYYIKPQ